MQQGIIFLISARLKWPRREAGKSPPSRAEVKDGRSFTCTAPYAFMARTGTPLPLLGF